MRRRNMPDGVMSPDFAADAVSADLKSARTAKRNAQSRPQASPSSGAPKLSKHDREFAALLDAARKGDKAAVQRLKKEYHAWVRPGTKTARSRAHADDRGACIQSRESYRGAAGGARMVSALSFFIPGRPRSRQTGSVITVNGRSFPVRRGTAWSSVCGLVARQYAPAEPLTGPVRCELTFFLARPKKPRSAWPTSRPDVENLCKGLLDSWNGVLWRDDSQVVDLRTCKVYARDGRVGVEVTVEGL